MYQEHRPLDFDENKQYPLLIEVYGGAGYQKVQDRLLNKNVFKFKLLNFTSFGTFHLITFRKLLTNLKKNNTKQKD